MKPIAQKVLETVRDRTRAGYGVNDSNQIEPLKGLAETTKARRRSFKRLSRFTTPEKSNLTMTGDMLRSLRAEVGKGNIKLVFTNTDAANKEEYARAGGRPFATLSQSEVTEIVKFYSDLINKG